MSEIASAYVSLLPSAKNFGRSTESQIGPQMSGVASRTGKRFGGLFASATMGPLKAIGGAMVGLFAVQKVKDFLGSAIDEARESQKVAALTAQVIKSTGAAANVSAADVDRLATAISNKTGIDDEQIASAQNLLLTFKAVKNEVGAGNDIFNQATRASVDMAAAMAAASGGQVDFRSSTTMLGKALNDPIKGLAAMARVGVQFTEGQQDQIKALVESGKTMEAQKAILAELESQFGGAAAAQATAGDKMEVAWGNLKEQIGTALLPVLDKVQTFMTAKAIPAVSDFIGEMQDGTGRGGEFVDLLERLEERGREAARAVIDVAVPLGKQLLPALSDIAGFASRVIQFFAGLPGPVKTFGAEAAVAAFAIVKVQSAFLSLQASLAVSKMGLFVADLKAAETQAARTSLVVTRLASVARLAAGAGGMALLADGANDSSDSLAGWGKTVGGATLAGAALGSVIPGVGTAVGALAGAGVGATVQMWRMATATESAGESAGIAEPKFESWTSTLDQATGAVTQYTRKLAQQKLAAEDIITQGMSLGIRARDLISASLGQRDAMSRVNQAMRENDDILKGLSYAKLTKFLTSNAAALHKDQRAFRQSNEEVKTWAQALRGLPKGVKVALKNMGYEATMKQVRALAKQYKLSPKKLVTKLELAGVNVVKKGAGDSRRALEGVGKVKGDLGPWLRSLVTGVDRGDSASRKGAQGIAKSLKDGTGKARADLSGFTRSVTSGVGPAKSAGSTGGRQVGENLKSGIFAGFAGTASALAAQAAAAVRSAVAAARAAGKIKSPSQVMRDEVGKPLADGMVVGFRQQAEKHKPKFAAVVRKIIRAANRALKESGKGSREALSSALESVRRAADRSAHHVGRSILRGIGKGLTKGLPELRKKFRSIAKMLKDGIDGKESGKRFQRQIDKVVSALDKKLGKATDRAQRRVDKLKGRVRDLKSTLVEMAQAVTQNYAPSFETNALFGPDGKLMSGTAVSSFMDQLKERKGLLDSVKAAYNKLLKGGLSGDWLQGLLASGNNNLILDLAAGSTGDALSAQQMYQDVQAAADALGQKVADNTTTRDQLDTAKKQLEKAEKQLESAERAEEKLAAIAEALKKLDKLNTLDRDIANKLNRIIAAANKKRKAA